jgi:hypothetical protein
MTFVQGRCETCAAFHRVRALPDGKKVGHCAIEALPAPVPATATCSRYRTVGGPLPPPPKRVAGEPRGQRSFRSSQPSASSAGAASTSSPFAAAPLPKEIDLDMDTDEFRRVLRQVLSEELALTPVELGGRWQGGEIILKPGKEGTAEKRIPLESFFHKIVMIRDRLRVLEAKLNGNDKLTDEEKVQLQQYVTNCYGSLTTFNILFADKNDGFSGQGSDQ